MADTTYTVKAGFFDAQNEDRVYSAADMTRPYKRLVADGVFASQNGQGGTDLQVVAGTGLQVIVKKGEAMIASRWFEVENDLNVTVPLNTGILDRIDSVIAQVDLRASGRAGNIVYRTGTAASTPQRPQINQTENVIELRLADVFVKGGASSVSQQNITDRRGSEDCPWVETLIRTVDTSTIYDQWQAAYAAYYDQSVEELDEFKTQQELAWDNWFSTLTDELTVTTNVIKLQNRVTVASSSRDVPIGIAAFDELHDALTVYLNGDIQPETAYTVSGSTVTFNTAVAAGSIVDFVVLHSVVSSDIDTVVAMIQRMSDKVDAYSYDTGWLSVPATNSSDNNSMKARRIGNVVFLQGNVMARNGNDVVIGTLPAECRPSVIHYYASTDFRGGSSSNASYPITIKIKTDGSIVLVNGQAWDSLGTLYVPVDTCFISNAGRGMGMIYDFKGTVQTYANLPASPNAGDVWYIATADATHGIESGDSVLWNGESWEVIETAITAAEITAIINSIQ